MCIRLLYRYLNFGTMIKSSNSGLFWLINTNKLFVSRIYCVYCCGGDFMKKTRKIYHGAIPDISYKLHWSSIILLGIKLIEGWKHLFPRNSCMTLKN